MSSWRILTLTDFNSFKTGNYNVRVTLANHSPVAFLWQEYNVKSTVQSTEVARENPLNPYP